jgi:hypothetical protein
MLPEKNQPACGTIPPTRSPVGWRIFLPSARNVAISFSHSAALEGYQLPAKTALLSFFDFMAHLFIAGSGRKAKGSRFLISKANAAEPVKFAVI